MPEWLVLVYKVPAEPSRLRAGIWRKLKAAGAIYLQNGAIALPALPASERILRGVADEARSLGGSAHLFRGAYFGDATALQTLFNATRDEEYAELIDRCGNFHAELARERAAAKFTFADLEENEEDLAKLEAWIAKIRLRDYFEAPSGAAAARALAACRADLERFAATVYRTADHGSASTTWTLADTEQQDGEPPA